VPSWIAFWDPSWAHVSWVSQPLVSWRTDNTKWPREAPRGMDALCCTLRCNPCRLRRESIESLHPPWCCWYVRCGAVGRMCGGEKQKEDPRQRSDCHVNEGIRLGVEATGDPRQRQHVREWIFGSGRF